MGGLSVATYADLLKGGASGPVLVAGDAAASKLVQVMQAGGHPGQFTPEELQSVIDWITAARRKDKVTRNRINQGVPLGRPVCFFIQIHPLNLVPHVRQKASPLRARLPHSVQ